MRVAMVCQPQDRLLADGMLSGSAGIVAAEIARHLGAGIDLTVYIGADGTPVEATRIVSGYRVVQIPVAGRQIEQGRELLSGLLPGLSAHSVSSAFHRRYFEQAAEQIRCQQPSLVHLHTYLQHAPTLRAVGAPVVLHLHHPHPLGFAPPAADQALRAVDAVVTCSEHLAQRMASHFPAHAAKMSMIGNGVDPSFFAGYPHADQGAPPRLLYVGRISPEKGVHVLARAFNHVVERWPSAQLDLVGRPGYLPASILHQFGRDARIKRLHQLYGRDPLTAVIRQVIFSRTSYRRRIERLLSPQARRRTNFRGAVPYSGMPQLYAASRVVVTPSVIPEPFGLPVVEAMAAGRPVVASRAGGIPELVQDGRTGLLVEPDDPEALAAALLALLADPERCRVMGAAARNEVAARWTWQLAAQRLRAVYASVTAGYSAR